MSRLSFFSKSVIRGILRQHAAEISFRTEIAGRGKGIQREIVAFGAFQGIVTLVVDKGETWAAYPRRERKSRNFAGGESFREVVCLYQTEIHPIRNRIGSRSGPGL